MADPDDIVETPRTPFGSGSEQEDGPGLIYRNSTKRKRSRKRRNFSRPQSSTQGSSLNQSPEEREMDDEGMGQMIRQQADRPTQGTLSTQEDYQTRFYNNYRKVAEEYDKDFLKKHGEDLDTTLIFAGLFSAVTSAFIIEVDSQLQPDSGDETAALLRVLIYKIDNTTFGTDVPALPQWIGPPRVMVHVQAILFASLASSLLAAFLAMLGKQWLNRYDSSDMRGSAVERGQNRQRKLDGMVAWYFDYVMESLPLMLQAALLLLGCALSRYLWDISTIVASVVLGVTSFGAFFYLFIIIAGATSENCPYQTPGSLTLHYLGLKVAGTTYSIPSEFWKISKESAVIAVIQTMRHTGLRWPDVVYFFRDIIVVPFAFASDIFCLGKAAIRKLFTLLRRAHQLVHRVRRHLHETCATPEQRFDQQMAVSDLRCISWTLQTSLDNGTRLSAVEHLATRTELTYFNPTLVADHCFDVLINCVRIGSGKMVTVQDKEQLATVSARCLLRSLHHLSAMDPPSSVLVDICRRYNRTFPFDFDSRGLPFHHAITNIHAMANQYWNPRNVKWDDYRPSHQEYTTFAQHMVEAAQVEYQQTNCRKVPRWILRFALHSLSLDTPPPVPVVADCLRIIAIDLGCQVSNTTALEASARTEQVSSVITRRLETMIEAANLDQIFSKRKAISTIIPFAVSLERDGQQETFDITLRAVRSSSPKKTMWHRALPYINTLFKESSPPSLNRVIVLITPHVPLCMRVDTSGQAVYRSRRKVDTVMDMQEPAVVRWAMAVSAVPYTEEVGQRVIEVTLQVASFQPFRGLIPVGVWAWFKERPSLPPECQGRLRGTDPHIVDYVRTLGDLEILKSYFLVLWSEWGFLSDNVLHAMESSLREDFCRTEMGQHREDLMQRLDHVLGELGRGLEYFTRYTTRYSDEDEIQASKDRYGKLKDVLLEVEREAAMKTSTRYHSTCALPLLCP